MDQLVDLVAEKAGIPQDKARIAVEVVANFLKNRLPNPIASQIDKVLAGEDPSKGIGGILGR